jgi:UPF0176 protein
MPIRIFTFYAFSPFNEERLKTIENALYELSEKHETRGLVILGKEGINSTMCAPCGKAETFTQELTTLLDIGNLDIKWSESNTHCFNDFKVKIRNEIVTLERTDIVPDCRHQHLSADEWDNAINEGAVVIDTRNSYEYDVGHFQNAIDPKTEEFSEFPEWVKKSGIAKDQKVLIYCTGGIRCEKAIYAMEEQGYKNVFQLDGGILRYLEKKPNAKFEGECFVFDHRVCVDQNLKPSERYRLCPHCGQPGKTEIECRQCHLHQIVCDKCLDAKPELHTCSKNCAHHFRLGHETKRIHWDSFNKYSPDKRPQAIKPRPQANNQD